MLKSKHFFATALGCNFLALAEKLADLRMTTFQSPAFRCAGEAFVANLETRATGDQQLNRFAMPVYRGPVQPAAAKEPFRIHIRALVQ